MCGPNKDFFFLIFRKFWKLSFAVFPPFSIRTDHMSCEMVWFPSSCLMVNIMKICTMCGLQTGLSKGGNKTLCTGLTSTWCVKHKQANWTSKHTRKPMRCIWSGLHTYEAQIRSGIFTAFGYQHRACSFIIYFTTSSATVSLSKTIFFFSCSQHRLHTVEDVYCSVIGCEWWDSSSCFSGPLPVFMAPETTVAMTVMRIEEGRGHRGRFLVTKISTRRMARRRSFSDVMARMVSWALFSKGSTAKSHQHHAGPLGFPWKHRHKKIRMNNILPS